MATGPEVFAAPLATAPRYGLLASIPPITTRLTVEGITYMPEGCVEGQTRNPCEPDDRVIGDRPDNVEWRPYVISVFDQCSTFSGFTEEEATARVMRLLNMDTERQLAHEFWTGDLASTAVDPNSDPWPNTWLANVADVDILSESGPVGFVHALACLEEYLAGTNGGQQGAIHATIQTISHWESFRLLRREGNRILTFQDNVVIQSPGYPGTSPDGTVGNNNIWAYATDMPRIYLGPIQGPWERKDQVDRDNNTVVMEVSRLGLVEWQRCRHAGVRLAMEVCDTGGS